ncbi:putative tetratricopeptide-like helical domain-containing protein [Rosa chinensis]|uniref:Putative tetratricopeptide-like helical domain-containing protein n=1 Tax=Rosa chinensis TaxID=74649 RepID=A0A2P6Q3K1_ROSCH|nr:putative tetratricopeptide-like helical domain-containing protein [Rosa chinensis]
MHKMPQIWLMYLQSLTEQKLITRTRRTFDRALCALPVQLHDRVWELYLAFVSQKGIPIETSLRVYRRYLQFDPTYVEDYINFLIDSSLWQEAAEKLASVLNDDEHGTKVSGINVDAIIRGGIKTFKDEVGSLWTSLADYYIKRSLFEEAMQSMYMMKEDEEEDEDEEADVRTNVNLSEVEFKKRFKFAHHFYFVVISPPN